jgi:hypothetical protein
VAGVARVNRDEGAACEAVAIGQEKIGGARDDQAVAQPAARIIRSMSRPLRQRREDAGAGARASERLSAGGERAAGSDAQQNGQHCGRPASKGARGARPAREQSFRAAEPAAIWSRPAWLAEASGADAANCRSRKQPASKPTAQRIVAAQACHDPLLSPFRRVIALGSPLDFEPSPHHMRADEAKLATNGHVNLMGHSRDDNSMRCVFGATVDERPHLQSEAPRLKNGPG